VPGGYVLPVTGAGGTAGYILALESPTATPAGVSVVQHIATVAALRLAMLAHEREVLRREGAETLAEMLQGVLDRAVIARRLAANGFAAGRALRLAIVRPKAAAPEDGGVADALAAAGLPHLILRQQDELAVLVHDDPAAQAALAGAEGAAVGLSRPFPDGGSVAIARREAQWALSRAVEAGRALVGYGEDRTERWLTGETADLRALVEQVLGAVIGYDAAHGGGLLTSVRVWLEHDRQTERAAQALHIHPNTLLYRVRRFEEISGRPLASTESLAEVWLALRTAAVLELPCP
jgi:purine catabolism regulator